MPANSNTSDATHRAVLVQVKPSIGLMSAIVEETIEADGSEQTDEKRFKRDIRNMYGLEDMESNSSVSSRRSSITEHDFNLAETDNDRQTPTPLLSMVNGPIDSEVKPSITIREHFRDIGKSALVVNRSLSSASSKQTLDDNALILTEYERFMQQHTELNQDPNPEIVMKVNPDERVYKQHVSIRYLVPPTPHPPGALIIRGIDS